MIPTPSRLAEEHRTLVLDASVILNLLGSGRAMEVLRILKRRIVLEELAGAEVKIDPLTGSSGRTALEGLQTAGVLSLERMSAGSYDHYLQMVGATPPEDIGDGESATLAHARGLGGIAVLDDRKAARIAAGRSGNPIVLTTMDLLASQAVVTALSVDLLSDTVFSALMNARMRVDGIFIEWVVQLIGTERANNCPSIRSQVLSRANRGRRASAGSLTKP